MKCGYNFKKGVGFGNLLSIFLQHIYYVLTWYSFSNTLGAWSYNGNNLYLRAYLQSIPNNSSSGSKSYTALTFSVDTTGMKKIIINNQMTGGGSTDNSGYNYLTISGGGLMSQKYLFTPTTGTYTNNTDLVLDVSSLSGIVTFSVWVNQTVRTGTLAWSTACDTYISRIYPTYNN